MKLEGDWVPELATLRKRRTCVKAANVRLSTLPHKTGTVIGYIVRPSLLMTAWGPWLSTSSNGPVPMGGSVHRWAGPEDPVSASAGGSQALHGRNHRGPPITGGNGRHTYVIALPL